MESKKTTQPTEEMASDNAGWVLLTGAVLCLAGYGLYKLLSKDTDRCKSIAAGKGADFIDDIIGRELS
jgi:hypothetical protein